MYGVCRRNPTRSQMVNFLMLVPFLFSLVERDLVGACCQQLNQSTVERGKEDNIDRGNYPKSVRPHLNATVLYYLLGS